MCDQCGTTARRWSPTRRTLLRTAGLTAGAGALWPGVLSAGASAAAADGPDPRLLTFTPSIQPRATWAGALCPVTGPLPVEAPGEVKFLLVHHTAEPGNVYAPEHVPELLRQMYRFHTGPAKRWSDLAYNFLVDRYGGIWEGRAGSLTMPVIPGATGGSQGFDQLGCFLGDHSTVPPTPQAQASMISLLAWLARRYAVDTTPGATVSFVSRGSNRWPAGAAVRTRTVEGHRAMSLTSCPGDAGQALVNGLLPVAVTQLNRAASLIDQHHLALGGDASVLGPPLDGERTAPDGGGRYRHYRSGSIWWSGATGAFEVHGAIRDAWSLHGGATGVLGYPVSDELSSPGGNHRFNHFQRGSVYWSGATGAHEVHGDILRAWQRVGAEGGVLGYPVSDELPAGDGAGRRSEFQRGSVSWSPATGAFEVYGAIRQEWVRLGAEGGRLGHPTSGEYDVAEGRAQDFTGGRLTWSRTTGVVTATRG